MRDSHSDLGMNAAFHNAGRSLTWTSTDADALVGECAEEKRPPYQAASLFDQTTDQTRHRAAYAAFGEAFRLYGSE